MGLERFKNGGGYNRAVLAAVSELIDQKIKVALDQYRLTLKPVVPGVIAEADDDATEAYLPEIPRDDVTELADLSVKHRRLIEENAKLRAALKPFADWARRDHVRGMPIDGPIVFGGPTGRDLNRAIEALES